MAVINVDDIYILGETGAQVDKVTGLFTKDEGTTNPEKAFAQLNIGTAGSNRNLLDNPWWGLNEVINQRGITSGNTDNLAYNIDRWQTSYGSVKGTWSLSADGLTISASDVAYNQQKIENYTKLNGKTVTASVMTSDGVVHSGTVTNLNWASSTIAFTDGNLRCQLASGGVFRVTSLNGSSNTIRAVKLELGSVSTLANDVPPNYVEELEKCKYYCRVIEGNVYTAVGQAVAGSSIRFPMQFAMRAKPSISVSGSIQAYGNGGMLTVSSITVSGKGNTCIELNCTVSGATSHSTYLLLPASGAKIILSADL